MNLVQISDNEAMSGSIFVLLRILGYQGRRIKIKLNNLTVQFAKKKPTSFKIDLNSYGTHSPVYHCHKPVLLCKWPLLQVCYKP